MTDSPTELETHEAVTFLLDFDPHGRHNIVAMDPLDDRLIIGRTFEPGDYAGMFCFVDKWNGKRNLYFSVNEPRAGAPHGKLSRADIVAARAVHADFDPQAGADLAEARLDAIARLAEAGPSIVLDSGGGVQAFWKFAEKIPLDDPAWLEALNASVRERFGGDPSVKNVDRVMRLPNTLNIPSKDKLKKHPGRQPRLAAIVTADGPTCDRLGLEQGFPPVQTSRAPRSEQPLVELDTPAAIRLATSYLVERAPEAIEGAGGDHTTFAVACSLRDYGVSEGVALELMLEHWNEQKASPPWAPDELSDKVGNAYRYASGGFGAKRADAEFGEVEGAGGDGVGDTEDVATASSRPTPIDLWANFEPPALPRGLLPKVLEEFAFSQGELMGADPGGLAASALAVCAAAIPDALKVQVKANSAEWKESARIWVALVGDPSVKKSPVMRRAMRPLRRMDETLAKAYDVRRRAYDALDKKEKQLKLEPRQRRLILEDATIEAAQEILRGSPDGVLCYQDELSGWFGSMDKYSGAKGSMKDRGFWLSSFNGDSYSIQRVTAGRSAHLPNLSVSMLGGIQPDNMRRLAGEAVDDGLLQRMFPIVLRRGPLGLDRAEHPSSAAYDRVVESLRAVATYDNDDASDFADIELQLLRFSPDAQEIRRQLERRHDELMGIEAVNPKLASHVGKLDGLFARLCVIWHAVEHVGERMPTTISADVARRVGAFMQEFLLPHALAFYASILGFASGHDVVASAAGQILAHPEKTKIQWRDLARGGNATKALTADEGRKVLEKLEFFGWLTALAPTGNQTAPRWKVNPIVHELFAERARTEKANREKTRQLLASLTAKAAA
jgi:hypothetical protein